MTCTNAHDTITQDAGMILPNFVISDFDRSLFEGGQVTSSCRVADGTWIAWFKNDTGNAVGDGTSKIVWPTNIADSLQIHVGYFADDGSPAIIHSLSVQSVCYRWGSTALYGIDDPCSRLPILGMRYSDNVKSELDGWFTAIKDVRVCTDGANVWVVVLANESADYPWLYGLEDTDACGNSHPSLPDKLASEGGDAFNHDTSIPGQRFWCHFGAPGQDDRGANNSFRWQPARVSVWWGDIAGFTLLDTIQAAYANNANWGLISGVEACASPAEPGVCHVMWSEGGPFGNQFIDGVSYGQRINYSQWDAAGKILDTDLLRSEGARASQGSAPGPGFEWVWTGEIILRNDHGSPIAIIWPWTGSITYPAIGSEPAFDGPTNPGPAEFWDLASGSVLQTMDDALTPTIAELPALATVVEQGALLANIAAENWAPAADFVVPRRVHYASSLYTDPTLSHQDVYLICSHYYDPGDFLTMPGGGIVPTPNTAFFRIPVDGSATFDYMDGTRLGGYSITQDFFGLISDFVSEPENVWVPSGQLSYLAQLNRQCLSGWTEWRAFPDATSFGVYDYGSPYTPINSVSPPTILHQDSGDWVSGGGMHYETPVTFNSEIDLGVVKAKICRCCAPCTRNLHIWQRL